MSGNPLDRAKALLETGAIAEAQALTTPLAEAADASHRALAMHATALKAAQRREEALDFDRQAVARFPTSGVAWHNLAATLGDLGRGRESIEAMERGFRLGLANPLSWGVMARSRAAVGDLDGAETAYQEALKMAPATTETAAEYAELVWMRRGDLAEALGVLDRCAVMGGNPPPLLLAKAKLYEGAGEPGRGADLLAAAAERLPDDPQILLAAAQAELERDRLDQAERLAMAAQRLRPDAPSVLNELAIIHLAQGRPDLALETARKGLEIAPSDQSLWGWAATAARAVGDPLHRELYDYEAMVRAYELEPPEGWASLDAFLKDLAATLRRLHVYSHHPANQSLRQGSQTTYRLTGSDEPAIQAFFRALDKPIRAHIAAMGEGRDPARSRNTGDYRIEGAWSVRLRPGGFHKDHFHPEGWLSSAFYVETPEAALETADRQGWLRFGQPPFKTVPALPAEHFVRPKPGRLVLFPSYMWHGTVPFTTDESRMTIAFDAVPK
jgi:uncharacterized protein (TIGR02466 family)